MALSGTPGQRISESLQRTEYPAKGTCEEDRNFCLSVEPGRQPEKTVSSDIPAASRAALIAFPKALKPHFGTGLFAIMIQIKERK